MGLDMYAFVLEPSQGIKKPRDVIRFRAPAHGPGLPEGSIQFLNWNSHDPFSVIRDLGDEFLGSKFVLPGSILLHRWRKHPNLHGWMARRWGRERNKNTLDRFTVQERIALDVQDMDALEHAVRNGNLPPTSGICFGKSTGEEVQDDLDFIAKARRALFEGKLVYYTSWW